ncbi:ead/Ea22-like family protein [Enterobacter cloacae]
MSNIDKQALRVAAEKAGAGEWCAFIDTKSKTYAVHTPGDNRCGDVVKWAGFDGQIQAADKAKFIAAANPATVLALLDELEAKDRSLADLYHRNYALTAKIEPMDRRIAELEALQGKPVMFIDGDISPADAEKLAAVIREFSEETETPAARMARIIRENPHPTNMCDMPAAGTAKGE